MIPERIVKQIEQDMRRLWTPLIRELKRQIGDEYRSDGQDPGDHTPRMDVTIGITPLPGGSPWFKWGYQTGDTQYMGGAYGHRIWATVTIDRRSRRKAVVDDLIDQAFDGLVEEEREWVEGKR